MKPGKSPEPAAKKMGFLDHLSELRSRIVRSVQIYLVAVALCWWQAPELFGWLARPLSQAIDRAGRSIGVFAELIQTAHLAAPRGYLRPIEHQSPILQGGIAEPFEVYMKVALYGGLFLSALFIFFQLWRFVAPGLYRNEKRWTLIVVISATLLFAGGVYYGYRLALPMMFEYLVTLHTTVPHTDLRMVLMQRESEYFGLVLQMLAVFGFTFELPLVIVFLGMIRLVTARTLWKFGRYYILIAFIVGAIFSPPDVYSQMMVTTPLLLLYLPSILLVFLLFGTRKAKPRPSQA